MAAPTSTNEVTARRLASVISQLWAKIKDSFVSKTGDETIAGEKTFTGAMEIKYGSYPQLIITSTSGYNTDARSISYQSDNDGRARIIEKTSAGEIDIIKYSNGKYNFSGYATSSGTATSATNVTGIVAVANGGTGSNTAVGARTNLGLGSLSTKSNVSDSDISGTISDTHIASASTWNAKQDALEFLDNVYQIGVLDAKSSLTAESSNNSNYGVWDVGEHSGSYNVDDSTLKNYSNIILMNGGNIPASPFVVNSSQCYTWKKISFILPMGGTFRFYNRRGSSAKIYARINGSTPTINDNSYTDVVVDVGGRLDLTYNGGNAVFISSKGSAENSVKWNGWKIKFGTPTTSDTDTICFF